MDNKYAVYLVGGAVRDQLMGQPAVDKDYVVINATPQDMTAMGYQQVGADFPVFLHPVTKDEYALARTERKSGDGYNGFVCETMDITLEDDLARRDLTINAMAVDNDGTIIDPFNGQLDLENKVLRHVSAAFAEDPVRVLRVARFYARYEGFTIAPETLDLMKNMVARGDLDHLTPERVWAETAKALTEKRSPIFFMMLHQVGAMAVIMPELTPNRGSFGDTDLTSSFVKLIQFQVMNREALDTFCQRLTIPNNLRDLARISITVNEFIDNDCTLLELFDSTDAFRRPAQFKAGLDVSVGERLNINISDKLDECLLINVKSLGIDPAKMDGKEIGHVISTARAVKIKGVSIKTFL